MLVIFLTRKSVGNLKSLKASWGVNIVGLSAPDEFVPKKEFGTVGEMMEIVSDDVPLIFLSFRLPRVAGEFEIDVIGGAQDVGVVEGLV